jgi:hypothetical protein
MAVERQLIKDRAEVEGQLQERRANLETAMQVLRGNQAVELAELDKKYELLRQTSQSAAVLYGQGTASIGAILAEPNMTLQNKEQAVSKAVELMKSGLAVIGSVGNINLKDLLDFKPNPEVGIPIIDPTTGLPSAPIKPIPPLFDPITGQPNPQ